MKSLSDTLFNINKRERGSSRYIFFSLFDTCEKGAKMWPVYGARTLSCTYVSCECEVKGVVCKWRERGPFLLLLFEVALHNLATEIRLQ
jgi:hypothetical protein